MEVTDPQLSSFEQVVVNIIRESGTEDLTNQQIRARVHQMQVVCTKYDVNKTLHDLKKRGVLQSETVGSNNHWKLQSSLVTTDDENAYDAIAYDSLVRHAKQNAATWRNSSPTNVLPVRLDKIVKFIENCALKGLRHEVLTRIAREIYENGWE